MRPSGTNMLVGRPSLYSMGIVHKRACRMLHVSRHPLSHILRTRFPQPREWRPSGIISPADFLTTVNLNDIAPLTSSIPRDNTFRFLEPSTPEAHTIQVEIFPYFPGGVPTVNVRIERPIKFAVKVLNCQNTLLEYSVHLHPSDKSVERPKFSRREHCTL